MPTPRIERETTITYNEEEDEAMVWSASRIFQRKMERLGIKHYKAGKRDGAGVDESRYYKVPKGWVKIRLPHKKPELTDEQRKERARLTRERFTKQAPAALPVSPSGEK